ncbi:glycosyl hydrolase family 95 catalytic domain-containing protein [Nonomuraea aurantiaca]|uniref:glycosyl hydrolase family 95 catalytic domain-containing protein n=1 Tax=Nonomuraea aurantiaca TaxID=2878562 RepID=UPI001CDA3936|nr:glycoside hydrolase N-terminal domain-containing protein [Nonomuraea aurantiaca]MCA2227707.1 glycoside hydrolase family 95 protein [Nonomuraea aurantiaca]
MPEHRIHDTEPGLTWEDAFLSGNGEYGIMVYGEPHAQRVVFDHHRFVLPNGTRDLRPPAIADRLGEIRELILSGRAAEAQRVAADGRGLVWTQAFHPGYELVVEGACAGPYRRVTDFTTGEIVVTTGFATGEVVGTAGGRAHHAFVSRADSVVVQRLTGELRLRLTGDLPGKPADVVYQTAAYEKDGHVFLSARGAYPAGLGAAGFEGLTLVLAADVSVSGDEVVTRGETLLLTKLDRYEEPGWGTDRLEAALNALAGHSYDELLARHVAIHRPIYERVTLDLGVAGDPPVGELIAEPPGPALIERLFHSGRYLLLSSSGVLPPRLTGLWLGAWGAAWSGDFTTDANLNLQLAGVNIGAMPELMAGYAALIRDQIDHWRVNAREIYGVDGILAPSRTDGESGYLFHFDEDWPWTMWLAGADWLLYPLHEHHQVTGELVEELPGWLAEAAAFWEEFLAGSGFVIVPSFSPEVGPEGSSYASVNATMDIAAARHALGLAGSPLAERLPPYRIDERGALTEWAWDAAPHEDHRHVSHLYPVWPLHEINPDDEPELAKAAHRALELRGDENLSAHGSLHRALAAARLKDAGLAQANLMKILGTDMLFRSLMTSHNPGREIYNADAAHTLHGLVIELLVDSRPGVVELLPAVRELLPKGTIRGVACRGRVVVEELTWGEGSVRAVLRSPVDQRIILIHRASGHREEVELVAGEPHLVVIDG